MSWIKKIFPAKAAGAGKKGVPEGLWAKCPNCTAVLYTAELNRNLDVCLKCDHHLRLGAKKRLDIFLDASPRELLAQQVEPKDFLKFKDSKKYKDRLAAAQKSTGLKDAILVIKGQTHQIPVIAAALDFAFIGGSMGAAVGESFVQAVNAAIETRSPFVCFATSGGARMQEALVSLLQMAKTSAVLARLASFKLPFISVLCDPTMGGVTASFAMLGDVIISEPNALIGFAGPRVIEQTVRQTLPEGFQRSEFLLAHGAIDLIVNRLEMKKTIAEILAMMTHRKSSIEELSDES